LLAAIFLFLLIGVITTFAISLTVTQWKAAAGGGGGGVVGIGLCGIVSIALLLATGYFFMAVYKGARDLTTPVYYTRGTVGRKRAEGGRKVDNWLTVSPRYVGTDLSVASQVTEEERVASPDRSQILQPRFASDAKPSRAGAGGYLPASRIYIAIPELEASGRSIVFRVDATSYTAVASGEEVLIAHSRFLQHVFYVAHLRAGEWEAYRNKQLI
jgi:hypothetical protein